ncbi:sensor histidine kinase [Streptomyces silvisoli]|uniref:sensor histidine kinase n=1 Tax=Streptomyces silvisoli TaxID=3034235 RepID=UPI0037042520
MPVPCGGVTLLARSRHWARAHPLAVDGALAAVVLGLILVSSVPGPPAHHYRAEPANVTLAVLACAALVVRRRFPRSVLAFTSVAAALGFVADRTSRSAPVVVTVFLALFTVAARTDRPTTWRVGAATCATLTAVSMRYGPAPWYSQEHLAVFAWTGMAAAGGDAVRSRRAYVAAIEERAVRAERTREEEARRRVAEERMRIARELHDVVAHHIALVNVQAGVAAHVMDSRPAQAKQALAHVREASRSALDELRATVGLLRQAGDPEAPMEPAPRLADLDRLVDGFVRTGLRAEVVTEGLADAAEPLPATVDLTAYRVIQESLTNAHKHAGPDARVRVRIVRDGTGVEITVLDDGTGGAAADAGHGGGHGLIGMRERATALGGRFEAGPRPEGGFRVFVRLPSAAPARLSGALGEAAATGEGRR